VNDRAFRLDFFIALAALLVSALTAGTLVYQTRVIGAQYAATIWPYLSVGATYDLDGETIEITNDGVGPALIRSAKLSVDGKELSSWNDYIRVLASDPSLRGNFLQTRAAFLRGSGPREALSMSSIGPATTLRPGETDTLFRLALAGTVSAEALHKHAVSMDFCYCSLNGSCWNLHAVAGETNPDRQPVSQCETAAAIAANVVSAPR
jgi:hypothetical protein